MYFVYIIKSQKFGKYYTGMTSNINRRIREHNSGINKSTKNKGPWFLVYKEEFLTKKEAWQREKQIKSYKSGQAFKNLFKNGRVA